MSTVTQTSSFGNAPFIPTEQKPASIKAARTPYQQALILDAAGISYLPIRIDGSKQPLVKEWKSLTKARPTAEQRDGWFGGGKMRGNALICGAVSGNLELIDFDDPELIAEYDRRLEARAPGLLSRLLIIHTPRGGRHLIYRCAEISGNTKLAMRWQSAAPNAENAVTRKGFEGRWERKALIETRGEGGYAVTVGSPARCHKLNKCYTLEQGDFANIPVITPDERALLLGLAAEFTEIEPAPERQTRTSDTSSTRPGDLFNADPRAYDEVLAALQADGWVSVGRGEKGLLLRRPGKSEGNSATLYDNGCLWVFSTNVSAFDSETLYDPFGIVMRLRYNGDPIAAAKGLAAQGYAQSQTKTDPRKLTSKERQDIWRGIESMGRRIAVLAGFSGEAIETHLAISSLLYVPGEEQAARGVAIAAIAARLNRKTKVQESRERTVQRAIRDLLQEQFTIGRVLLLQTRPGGREKNLYWDFLTPLADEAHQAALANMTRLKEEGFETYQVFELYAQEALAKLPIAENSEAGAALIQDGSGQAQMVTLPALPGTSTMSLSDYANDQLNRKLAGAEKVCDGIIERGKASDDEWHGYNEAGAWLADYIEALKKMKAGLEKRQTPAARKRAKRLALATVQLEAERWADEPQSEPETENSECVALNNTKGTLCNLGRHEDSSGHESPDGPFEGDKLSPLNVALESPKGDKLSPLDVVKPSETNDLIFRQCETETVPGELEIEFSDLPDEYAEAAAVMIEEGMSEAEAVAIATREWARQFESENNQPIGKPPNTLDRPPAVTGRRPQARGLEVAR